MEYKNLFDTESVLDAVASVARLFRYDNAADYLQANKTELFFQWLDIYWDLAEQKTTIGDLEIERFPYGIFGYTSYFEFVKDMLPHLISFYCLKVKSIDDVHVSELFNIWIKADLSLESNSKDYCSILGKIFILN